MLDKNPPTTAGAWIALGADSDARIALNPAFFVAHRAYWLPAAARPPLVMQYGSCVAIVKDGDVVWGKKRISEIGHITLTSAVLRADCGLCLTCRTPFTSLVSVRHETVFTCSPSCALCQCRLIPSLFVQSLRVAGSVCFGLRRFCSLCSSCQLYQRGIPQLVYCCDAG